MQQLVTRMMRNFFISYKVSTITGLGLKIKQEAISLSPMFGKASCNWLPALFACFLGRAVN